jgi:hypothetical protein
MQNYTLPGRDSTTDLRKVKFRETMNKTLEHSVKAQNRYNGTKPSEEEEEEEEEGRITNSYHVSFYGELLLAPT